MQRLDYADYQVLRQGARVIEADGHGEKVLLLPDGNFLKLFRRKRVITSAALFPYAQRFASNTEALRKRDIPCPRILATYRVAEIERDVVHYAPLPGDTLRQLITGAEPPPRALLTQFATFVAGLHERGVYFRSLHLGNVVMTPEGELGLIDANKCQRLFSRWVEVKTLDAAFICGPQAMTETVRDQLKAHGMDSRRIHFELFGAAVDGSKREAREAARQLDAAVSQITVISDGRALAFDLPRNTVSVLDAGNAIGAELPYSCKAGVCSTCKCRVIEGEVEMDANHALEDYEVAAGYVLSCQTFPLSQKVVLDFDQI